MENLKYLGWNNFFKEQFNKFINSKFLPARVIREDKQRYILSNQNGLFTGEVTGKLLYDSTSISELPKTGDWVVVQYFDEENKAVIHYVLRRKSAFSRKAAGKNFNEQVIAANIDILFIVQSLDENYSLNRIERYLFSSLTGDIKPALIFNKTDIDADFHIKELEIINIFPNYSCFFISAKTGYGINNLNNFIRKGKTYAFVGSSGVGKSTIINTLLGEDKIKTQEVRLTDSKGKHTTARRELYIIPSGGLIIDTPGMREFQLWETANVTGSAFREIEELSLKCKFSNCTHTVEPDCAIKEALENGNLNIKRFESYNKLMKEEEYLKSKIDKESFLERKEKAKKLHKEIKRINKGRKKF